MPRLLRSDEIISAIEGNTFIKNGNINNAEGIKYDFTLGNMVLSAEYPSGLDTSKLEELQLRKLNIEPGEIAFVLSQEELSLPKDLKALLIPKRKLSYAGILILGGLSIDPLYKGKLLIGLYNFSSTRFPLSPGRKIIAAQFYQLQQDEIGIIDSPEASIYDFPDNLKEMMSRYHPVSVNSINQQVAKLETSFSLLRDEWKSKDIFFERFEHNLSEQQIKIDNILRLIEGETIERKEKDLDLNNAILATTKMIQGAVSKINVTYILVISFFLAVIVGLVIVFAEHFFFK